MSAVTLPQKAGYVATTKEWDDLVRIAENLASQVVQRDAALRQMQAERDAAREHAERQQLSKDGLYRELREMSSQRDAARAELRVLRGIAEDTEGWAALFGTASRDALLIEATIKGLRAIHAGSVEALDAARAEVARLTTENSFLNGGAVADKQEIDSLLAENDRLTAALDALIKQADVAWATLDHTENERLVSRLGCAVDDARAALRGQPAPAQGQE